MPSERGKEVELKALSSRSSRESRLTSPGPVSCSFAAYTLKTKMGLTLLSLQLHLTKTWVSFTGWKEHRSCLLLLLYWQTNRMHVAHECVVPFWACRLPREITPGTQKLDWFFFFFNHCNCWFPGTWVAQSTEFQYAYGHTAFVAVQQEVFSGGKNRMERVQNSSSEGKQQSSAFWF